MRWIFHTIPRPGESGSETWPPDAWQRVGGANSWAGITVDEARGIAFVPTGSATYDFYGGDRAGDNLFANTLLALDAATGKRLWHYQIVRHDVWDRDLPAPPDLVTIERDGRSIDAVAQITKSGHVFLFERETGAPLHPIEEVPVPGPGAARRSAREDAARARAAAALRAPAHDARRDVTERTPEAHAAVLAKLQRARPAVPFQPPSLEGTVVFPGMDGGGEWGGAAFDPESGLLYVNANDVPYWLQMLETPDVSGAGGIGRATYVTACAMCHGLDRRGDGSGVPSLVELYERMGPLDVWRVVRDGRGRMPGFGGLLPLVAIPPLLWYLWSPDDADAARARRARRRERAQARLLPALHERGLAEVPRPRGLPRGEAALGHADRDRPRAGRARLAGAARRDPGARGAGPARHRRRELRRPGRDGRRPRLHRRRAWTRSCAPSTSARARCSSRRRCPRPASRRPPSTRRTARQFVVVAAGGGKLGRPSGDRYVAFALPEEESP